MNTTKGKSVPEALRMIADWVEKGRTVQFNSVIYGWKDSDLYSGDPAELKEYRAKPEKPRVCCVMFELSGDAVKAIELTPEVKEACRAAGIEVDCD